MENSSLAVSALSVLIVSRHTLVREGLKAMIADTPFRIVCERDSVRSAVEQPAGNVALVLLGVSHQFIAMVLLMIIVTLIFVVRRKR